MEKIKIEGLPSIPKKVWVDHKVLYGKCRQQRAAGFGQGTEPYEAALDALKRHAFAHNLLLGHIHAIENEYAREYP